MDRTDSYMAIRCFKLLSKLKGLPRLMIKMDEPALCDRHRFDIDKLDGEDVLLDLPGINELRRLRGLEDVVFLGDCPRIAAVLPQEMTQPQTVSKE